MLAVGTGRRRSEAIGFVCILVRCRDDSRLLPLQITGLTIEAKEFELQLPAVLRPHR